MMSVARTKGEKDKRLHEIEMKIAALEEKQKELAAPLEDPAAYNTGRPCHCDQSRSLRCRPTTWSAGPEFGPKWYPLALVALALPSVWAGGKLARRATAEN
jgi:hypothetical protein